MDPTNNPIYQIGLDIATLCREEAYSTIYDKYYTDESRAIEAMSWDGSDPVTVWVDALKQKAKKRAAMATTVSIKVSNPSFVNGKQFILWMEITTKNPDNWEQKTDAEYVLYTVEHGKVVEEKFFYCT